MIVPSRAYRARLISPEIQEVLEIVRRMNAVQTPPVVRPRYRVLKDRWVTVRTPRECARGCGSWFTFGEQMRNVVVATPDGIVSEYSCWPCNDGRSGNGWERDLEAELDAQWDDGRDIPF